MRLTWPTELTNDSEHYCWSQAESNLCLDFHGDPTQAELVVFSDGNHHMALLECLRAFQQQHPELGGIFYATTPPAVVINFLKQGKLQLGNLILRVTPHLFISPPDILDNLQREGYLARHTPFMQSRGMVLLVRHGNPKHILDANDLRRPDIRLFISNPHQEAASFRAYVQTLQNFMRNHTEALSSDIALLQQQIPLYIGERIHHREAPQAVFDGRADAAILYYHLALRYTRIFPGEFSIIALDRQQPVEPIADPRQIQTTFHLGLVQEGGNWGKRLREFLFSNTAATIYNSHGLTKPA